MTAYWLNVDNIPLRLAPTILPPKFSCSYFLFIFKYIPLNYFSLISPPLQPFSYSSHLYSLIEVFDFYASVFGVLKNTTIFVVP
jgi:hypothetical protein